MEVLKYGIAVQDAEQILLDLCDAADRLNYKGVSGIFASVQRLAKYTCSVGTDQHSVCGRAYQRFADAMSARLVPVCADEGE